MRPTVRRWPLSNVTAPTGALIESPAMVRAHVGAVLTIWQMRDLRDVAELVVSELVTNVVAGATEPDGKTPRYIDGMLPVYQVGLFSDRAELRIEVFDTVPGMPMRRNASPDDEHGRGLALVEAMTGGRWGSFPHRGGKVVFAHVQNAELGLVPATHPYRWRTHVLSAHRRSVSRRAHHRQPWARGRYQDRP